MARTGGRLRTIGLVAALALAALMMGAGEARGEKYEVAQCGWHIGAEADWDDSTGGAKFRRDAYCATSQNADPFDGVHMKSFVRPGQAPTVSGTRYARWRWVAPPHTSIVKVQGTWWHALHDGFEHRLGTSDSGGRFHVFAVDSHTNTTLRSFVAGFSHPRYTFQSRLLCARAASKHCDLSPTSWSSVRAVTLTLEDNGDPGASLGGGLLDGGWQRGSQSVHVGAGDNGSGARFGETHIDGSRAAVTEFGCDKAMIGGTWKAKRMRPCPTDAGATHSVDTRKLSDGRHTVRVCAEDFAGNESCSGSRDFHVDNNAPGSPRQLEVTGGDGWRRANDFDIAWRNPGQGGASPIAGAAYRVSGPTGFDSGEVFAGGRGRQGLSGLKVPGPGSYRLEVWLRDEAGNESRDGAVEVALRLDDVAPGLAFEAGGDPAQSGRVTAQLGDAHSGPAGGAISYRKAGAAEWTGLHTELRDVEGEEVVALVAKLPLDGMEPGLYELRAGASDAAGNEATTKLRSDGTEMTLRIEPPPEPPAEASESKKEKKQKKGSEPKGSESTPRARRRVRTRLFGRLKRGRRRAQRLTVRFGADARLLGRLVRVDGAGVAGRRLLVVSRPSQGARARARRRIVVTGRRGGFRVSLPAGPSRRVAVRFRGDAGLAPARRPDLALRVRGGVALRLARRHLRTGQLLRIGGRVRARGATLPRRGKLVAIQYFETEARRWRPILVTRTDRAGRIRARYRFRYVTGTARILLRAVALPEEGWPYAPGASPPRTVAVKG